MSVSEGLDIPVSEGLETSTRGSCRSNETHVRSNSNASYRKSCQFIYTTLAFTNIPEAPFQISPAKFKWGYLNTDVAPV